VNEPAARAALEDLVERCGAKYPAIIRLWRNAWEEFIPFLDYVPRATPVPWWVLGHTDDTTLGSVADEVPAPGCRQVANDRWVARQRSVMAKPTGPLLEAQRRTATPTMARRAGRLGFGDHD